MIFTPRLGLALGGGAARGLAHLGVLEVLEERGRLPHAIAGTSIGALIAAIWLTSDSVASAIDRVSTFVRSESYRGAELEFVSRAGSSRPDGWASMIARSMRRGLFFTRAYRQVSWVSDENYRHNVESLVPDVTIDSLDRPLAITAADLVSGEPVVFRRGSLRDAVLASSAVPGVMPPQEHGARLLADGGLVDKIPVRALLGGPADVIAGVDVSTELEPDEACRRGIDVINRSGRVTEWALRHARLALADVAIRPRVQDIDWLDFAAALPAVERGRHAAEAAMPEIERALGRARWLALVGGTRTRRLGRSYERGLTGPRFSEM